MFLPLLKAFLKEAKDDFLGKLEELDAAMEECDEWTKEVWDLLGYRAVTELVESTDVTESPLAWALK